MCPEVFDKLNAFILFLLPKLDMAITTCCDQEICSETKKGVFAKVMMIS